MNEVAERNQTMGTEQSMNTASRIEELVPQLLDDRKRTPFEPWARQKMKEAADLLLHLKPVLEENERYRGELEWIEALAQVRAKDEHKVFAKVARGALRVIASRCDAALSQKGER